MSDQQRQSSPSDILAAAQAALDAAQQVARSSFDTAIRLPPASAQLAATMPDLIENLAKSVDRLNRTLDRVDRMLTLAEPMLGMIDRLIPRLEDVAAAGDELRRVLNIIPGVGVLTRLAGLSEEDADKIAKQPEKNVGKGRPRR
ncbi:hypothetical protein [Skermania sp. ID1734]|uniref:hypothetical protein n=1 Tax=Skermania sp. ID1734 TaxID=2597516 RepID=UPI00163DE224|nr:hypothetical protein [Skermania sp. ID1734]